MDPVLIIKIDHRGDLFEVFINASKEVSSIIVFPLRRPNRGTIVTLRECPWPVRDEIERELASL